ncbi:MAG: DNA starvation/stationary phase protection protein [Dysgonamonadaceae bacterium]|jgi:starvation-inducible DNA-binding protein|nr:DNA starvation/stationary phase protection protein [Dysgonamonadaceae bacterium]
MSKLNSVGLDTAVVKPIIGELEALLANYQVFYTNLRGLHWLIEGDKFFELHPIYEEYYNEFAEAIDTIAERIIMLGGKPESRFSEYIKQSDIQELAGVTDWLKGVNAILESLKLLLVKLHSLQALAVKAGDSGTIHFLAHQIKSFEKKVWMLSVYIK